MHPPLWLRDMDPACRLWKKKKDPGFKDYLSEKTSPHFLPGAQDQWLVVDHDQLSCRSTRTTAGNCEEMETQIMWACHTPQQPLQNHSSVHFGGYAAVSTGNSWWATSKSGHPCPCQNCTWCHSVEKTGRSLLNHPSCPVMTRSVEGLNWMELNWIVWFNITCGHPPSKINTLSVFHHQKPSYARKTKCQFTIIVLCLKWSVLCIPFVFFCQFSLLFTVLFVFWFCDHLDNSLLWPKWFWQIRDLAGVISHANVMD